MTSTTPTTPTTPTRAAPAPSPGVRLAIGAVTANTRRAIDTAVRLARSAGAELACVFVEEDDLMRAAALPITREVGVVSAVAGEFATAHLAGALRRHAALAERALAAAAGPARVRWSFEIGQGSLRETAQARARAQDLLVIGVPCLALEPALGTPDRGSVALLSTDDGPLRALETALGGPGIRLTRLAPGHGPLAGEVERLRPQVLAVTREALASAPPELWRALRRLGVTVVAAPPAAHG